MALSLFSNDPFFADWMLGPSSLLSHPATTSSSSSHGRERLLAALGSTDIVENEQGLEIRVDVPGCAPENLSVEYENNRLTISGKRDSHIDEQDPKTKVHRLERVSGQFSRSFVLPSTMDSSKITADFKHGCLVVNVPRAPEANKKAKVAINAA
jgi:HSP20 family protein